MTAPTTPIRVLIVEDSPLVRHGIRAALGSEPAGEPIEIVGEAGTAHAALGEALRLKPDVVLLDLRLPDDSGLNVCRRLRQLLPQTCIIVLTSSTDNQSIHDSVVAGAQGYLLKEINPATLITAIKDGFAGRPVFSGDLAGRILDLIRHSQTNSGAAGGLAALSPQERKVLAVMAAGHTNKGIAEQMNLSENTVKNYITSLFEKLHVARRSQAVALFLNSRPPAD